MDLKMTMGLGRHAHGAYIFWGNEAKNFIMFWKEPVTEITTVELVCLNILQIVLVHAFSDRPWGRYSRVSMFWKIIPGITHRKVRNRKQKISGQ